MTYLLDGNLLVALAIHDHEFHRRSLDWFNSMLGQEHEFATCPITEGTLLRLMLILDKNASCLTAWKTLQDIRSLSTHQSWLDNFSYADLPLNGIQGHRQITDAWLVELARRKKGKLATLNAALATLHPDIAELIPVVL